MPKALFSYRVLEPILSASKAQSQDKARAAKKPGAAAPATPLG
jgi:hypothetical protein